MKFEDLQLKDFQKEEPMFKTISFKIGEVEKEVKVKQYLPVSDKIDLVQIALQQSQEDGVYNEILLDMYFNLYLAVFYTDIEFDKEKFQENTMEIYDDLKSCGLLDTIISAMPEEEYRDLFDFLTAQRKAYLDYKTTAAYILTDFFENLPMQMEQVSEILNNFDPNKFQAVKNFAEAANGNRDIQTNQPIKTVK